MTNIFLWKLASCFLSGFLLILLSRWKVLLTSFESRRAPPISSWQCLYCYSSAWNVISSLILIDHIFSSSQHHLFSDSHFFLKLLSYLNLPFSCIAFSSPDTIYHIFICFFVSYITFYITAFFMVSSTVWLVPQCLEQGLPYSTFLINIHWINKLLPNTWDLQTWPLTKDSLFKLVYPIE